MSSTNTVPLATLSNKCKIPLFGLGTWKSAPGQVKDAVACAIRVGYRHIDCAHVYGNEKEVGEGIKECLDEGICKREDLFVTSKLWNDSHAKEDVEPALRLTLKNLMLNYLDMYLIHWPVNLKKGASFPTNAEHFVDVPMEETWKAMEGLVENGLTKGIGVSNFSVKKLEHLLSICRIPPAINQIERHPYLQLNPVMDFCKKHNIHVTAYSPLGSSDRPQMASQNDIPALLDDETVHAIAERHGKSVTAAHILIQWAMQCGTSVIPKSVTPSRIESNFFGATQLELTKEDMMNLATLDKHMRYVDGAFWCVEGGPITLETLWDGD